jgi:acyl-CoA reductase-like NAD-dependent aldehyde dehydrogenase/nicotinamidase-related amidase
VRAVLLLVDLQNDFLAAEGLFPARDQLVSGAARLLEGCRAASVPVVHVWTTVSRQVDDRMPHWRRDGRWQCVAGTEGHRPPESLRPRDERVVHKTHFSAFSAPELGPCLGELRADTLIVAGVHLHGCVRATVLDGYARGFRVWVVQDAVGSAEPVHAAITRSYLEQRAASFLPVDSVVAGVASSRGAEQVAEPGGWIERRSPRRLAEFLWRVPVATDSEVVDATAAAARAGSQWRATGLEQRVALLERLAGLVDSRREDLAKRVAHEIGTPIRFSTAEVDRAAAVVRAAARPPAIAEERTPEADLRRAPLGVVAQVTPWNNSVGISLGKIAPALYYGNAVVWKPAPAASGLAGVVQELIAEAGFPPDLVRVVYGYEETAAAVMADPAIDAVSLTGSSMAGYVAQAICGERRIPLQAELGGNNAAIVWSDRDLPGAAAAVAEGGFGAAGQRCTANRRVIVADACHGDFVDQLELAAAGLEIGDPLDPRVSIGPLVDDVARDRVAAVVRRARRYAVIREPFREHAALRELAGSGSYHAPVIVVCDDPTSEVVQEETFGPVIVVQRASTFERAVELLNGVRQGLVAALFSDSPDLERHFVQSAQAGVLKLNQTTAGAGVKTPFGGWKSAGVGPPEHGAANRDFYTRPQAIYR